MPCITAILIVFLVSEGQEMVAQELKEKAMEKKYRKVRFVGSFIVVDSVDSFPLMHVYHRAKKGKTEDSAAEEKACSRLWKRRDSELSPRMGGQTGVHPGVKAIGRSEAVVTTMIEYVSQFVLDGAPVTTVYRLRTDHVT